MGALRDADGAGAADVADADAHRLGDKPHPLAASSWLSRLTWGWFFPLLWLGQRKQLDDGDVWDLPPRMRAAALREVFSERQRRFPGMTLRQHLARMFWRRWALAGACYIGWCLSAAVQPFLVAAIVRHLEDDDSEADRGVMLAFLLFFATIAYSFFINHKFGLLVANGVEIRALLSGLLYRKVLTVALSEGLSTGEATNLISNDCERVFDAHLLLHYMWASPIFVVVVIVLATLELGPAALIGFGLLFLLIPIQVHYGKRVGARKRGMMPKTDKRTELFSQVLNGIEVVKLYSWEDPYEDRLQECRADELKDLWVIDLIRASMRGVLYVAPALIPGATLVAYVLLGNELTLSAAYLAISFFAIVRFPTLIIPMAFSYYYEMIVSLNRIDKFLAMADMPAIAHSSGGGRKGEDSAHKDNNAAGSGGVLVNAVADSDARGASDPLSTRPPAPVTAEWSGVFWDSKRERQALKQVAVQIPAGALVGITGVVGSGKTAFLLALLDELIVAKDSTRGSDGGGDGAPPARPPPTVGYFAQTPNILNGTFEDNVAFGLPFDQERFDAAVACACLDADLEIMPAGSKTEIGENGVNLSGGQKARVAFARLLYHRDRCDVFVIDDLFSAVDVHVGKRMFDLGVNGQLSGRTRVVAASSQVELLDGADVVLRVADGGVEVVRSSAVASADDGGAEHSAKVTASMAARAGASVGAGAGSTAGSQRSNLSPPPSRPPTPPAEGADQPPGSPDSATVLTSDGDADKSRVAGENLTSREHRVAGGVSRDVVASYFAFAAPGHGAALMYSVAAVYVVGQTVRVMCDVWIAWWADAASNAPNSAAPDGLERQGNTYWIWTLCVWNGVNIAFTFCRTTWTAFMSVRASNGIHRSVLKSLLAAPLLFFHQNPPGRILNRLSTDLHKIDILLPDLLYQFLDNFFVLLSAVVLAVVAVPWLLLLLVVVGLAYYRIQQLYRATSRELHRLDGTTKSPVFGLCTESVGARVTIRAFRMVDHFLGLGEVMFNRNLKVYLAVRLLERWISTYMNLAASMFTTALVMFAVLARGQIDAAMVGLALVYCLQLLGLSSWTMMVFVQVEANMTSLERLKELSAVPPQETDGVRAAYADPPAGWPRTGRVTMRGAKLRYRDDLPLALKGIDLDVASREKIGICGRTGAGKSSMLALLFRLFEPAKDGTVEVDGVDVTTVALRRLRGALAIVPQDPVLFNGTVRSNLDPWGEADDAALWSVLDKVTLRDTVRALPGQLNESVGTAGDRLSHGQRQLVCIARALLKPSTILLCDEATSSVDSATDAVIQRLIREAFEDRTVLTIAHRLHTILDSDRVLVLDGGLKAEFDTPAALLRRPDGLFRRMLESTSPEAAARVLRDAGEVESDGGVVGADTDVVEGAAASGQFDGGWEDGGDGQDFGRLRNASLPHVQPFELSELGIAPAKEEKAEKEEAGGGGDNGGNGGNGGGNGADGSGGGGVATDGRSPGLGDPGALTAGQSVGSASVVGRTPSYSEAVHGPEE